MSDKDTIQRQHSDIWRLLKEKAELFDANVALKDEIAGYVNLLDRYQRLLNAAEGRENSDWRTELD